MAKKVRSTGPVPCAYLLIGERPGKVEAQRGVCFCGPSGEELNRYLFVNAGLNRDDVHVMNMVPTYAETSPTQAEIDEWWGETTAEVDDVNPDYVILMGLHAARAGLGNYIDMEWAN